MTYLQNAAMVAAGPLLQVLRALCCDRLRRVHQSRSLLTSAHLRGGTSTDAAGTCQAGSCGLLLNHLQLALGHAGCRV